jgi:dTDP-4-amino-4,6-dideoxygalactose transaminase
LEKLSCTRDDFFNALRAENIGVNVHYIPIYYHPYYVELGYEKGLCPNAEYIFERIISLPLHPGLSKEDVNCTIEAVCKIAQFYSR